MANHIIAFIRMAVLVITLIIWFFIGFIFWVPLLARTISVFSLSMLHANITGTDSSYYSSVLDKAVIFYVSGFSRIMETMQLRSLNDETHLSMPTFHWTRFAIEVATTIIFWGFVILMFSTPGFFSGQ